MVCASHAASDWLLTDEESVGEDRLLDNGGQETWSLTHVYSLLVCVPSGYKGVFVETRATTGFTQTYGLRRCGDLKRCLNTLVINVCITIRWARVEACSFRLRDLLNFAKHLAGGGLVEPYVVDHTARLYGIQETKCTHTVHISCVLCQIEGDLRQWQRKWDLMLSIGKTGVSPKRL